MIAANYKCRKEQLGIHFYSIGKSKNFVESRYKYEKINYV